MEIKINIRLENPIDGHLKNFIQASFQQKHGHHMLSHPCFTSKLIN